jgi:CheY-like chemotaxis protein
MAVLRDALLRQPTALVSSPYSRKSHYLKITVEDTGIGLSEAERAALFQPFKQAQRYTGGTGLGLFSLSKRVDALGGSYGVTGRSDGLRGSAFWFTIPYRPDKSLTPSAAALMRSGRVTAKVSTNNSRCESPEHRIPGSGTAAAAASTTGNNIAAVHNYTNSNNNNNSNNHGIRKRTQFESVLTPVFSPNVNMVGPIEATVESPQNLLPITGLRVLIVDDALTILKVSGKHIEQAGHIVETAKNGFIGLNRMTESLLAQRKSRSMAEDGLLTDEKGDDDVEAADVKNKILDLVLMDLQMPVMGTLNTYIHP